MHCWTPWHKPDVDKVVSLYYTPGSVMGHEDDNVVSAEVDGQSVTDSAQANVIKNKARALMLARNALLAAMSAEPEAQFSVTVKWDANQVEFAALNDMALAVFNEGAWSPLVAKV